MFSSTKHAVEGFPMIPNSHFLLGHLPLMRDDDFRKVQHKFSIEHADAQGRCCFWMGNTPALSVSTAKDAQFVLKQSVERSTFALMTKHMHECFGKRSIVLLNKKEWKSNRSAIVKALHATDAQQSYAQNMMEASDVLIQSLSQQIQVDSSSSHTIMEIGYLMKCLTMDIFGRSAMTADFRCAKELKLSPIATAFEYLSSEMMRRITNIIDPTNYFYSLPLQKNRRLAKERDCLRGYIHGVVEERRKILETTTRSTSELAKCPQDLLTNLIKTQNHFKEQTGDEELSEETLVDVLMSLLIAGYDTTSVTLTYALYLVSQNPNVEATCLQELGRVWKATDTQSSLSAWNFNYTFSRTSHRLGWRYN
jgi:cytochrome P450